MLIKNILTGHANPFNANPFDIASNPKYRYYFQSGWVAEYEASMARAEGLKVQSTPTPTKMPDVYYKGPTTLKRKDTGEIVNLTGEGYWDPNAFTLVSGGTVPAPAPVPPPAPTITPGVVAAPTATPVSTVLTPAQIQQYYATEGQKANPLSPLDWLARQQAPTPTPIPIPTTTPITSAITQPKTEIPYVSPAQTPIYPPTQISPPTYEATPKERSISDLIAEITASSGIAGERAAYQIEQEKALGLETLRTAEADYFAQYTQLQADYANIENKQALAAQGRGITTEVLSRLTMGEQRKLAIQVNTIGALLAATQGKITFAQSQADRAVNQKYAQQEADRQSKIENLGILLRDPTLTVEQKQRANAQLDYQNKMAEADDKKKADTSQIMKWAIELATNPTVAQQLMQMAQSNTPDLNSAFALYSQNKPVGGVTEGQEFTRVKQIVDMYPNEWGQAASKIDATFGAGTSTRYDAYLKSVYQEGGVGTTGGKPLTAGDTAIRNWILKNKQANPNVPYYDLWGQLAEEMRKQGLNPSNYDKIFWEILHPEGEAGYAKYQGGTTTGTIENPFK